MKTLSFLLSSFSLIFVGLIVVACGGNDDEPCDARCERENILTSAAWVVTDVEPGNNPDAIEFLRGYWIDSRYAFNKDKTYELYISGLDENFSGTWNWIDQTGNAIYLVDGPQMDIEQISGDILKLGTFLGGVGTHTLVLQPEG